MKESNPLAPKFERLWSDAGPIISAFVVSVFRDSHQRDDLMQEVSKAVIENYSSYDPKRSFTAWAMGIAQKQLMVFLRKQKCSKAVFDHKTISQIASAFSQLESDVTQRATILRECMDDLDERSRQIFEMRYQHSMDVQDIATCFGMKTDTVYRLLQRLRDQLQVSVESRLKLQEAKKLPTSETKGTARATNGSMEPRYTGGSDNAKSQEPSIASS